jgi:hypothetical protein
MGKLSKKSLMFHFLESLISGFCISMGDILARKLLYSDSAEVEMEEDEEEQEVEEEDQGHECCSCRCAKTPVPVTPVPDSKTLKIFIPFVVSEL